ncbi:MAG: AraC family transcriptional regulator [Ruminococcaceae bacterium]|nr:AraC family transcriptional regulator [Oscillospiraceae bacterium]
MAILNWKNINISDVCIYDISFVSGFRKAGRTVNFKEHGRSKNAILYIEQGSADFFEEGKATKTASKGDLVLIPKGDRYIVKFKEDDTKIYLVNYDMILPDSTPVCFADEIEIIMHTMAAAYIKEILSKIEASFLREDNAAIFRRKELVYRLLSNIFQDEWSTLLPNNPKFSNIAKGIRMLQQTYLENIPISHIAKACNIGVSSFRRLFTECYGISPVNYRNQLRIRRAKLLLRDGGYTISEVAEESGFSNVAYFCRYYKKMVGESPGKVLFKAKSKSE